MQNESMITTKPQKKLFRKASQSPILWLAPLFLVLCVFYLIPLVDVIKTSFTSATMTNPNGNGFTLESYLKVFQDDAFGDER